MVGRGRPAPTPPPPGLSSSLPPLGLQVDMTQQGSQGCTRPMQQTRPCHPTEQPQGLTEGVGVAADGVCAACDSASMVVWVEDSSHY
jgi:hypothetical protein